MKEKILKNWPYMLLAFVLAFALWFVVIQVTDPQTDKEIEIPIEFTNEDVITNRGMVVELVGDPKVTIKVSKARSQVTKLSESDFSAVADYSKMYRDTQVPITVTSRNANVKAEDFEQLEASVEVKLESLQTVNRVIEYELIGTPSTGYVVNSVTTEPDSVAITCPESMVPYIRTAKVYVDVTDMKNSASISAQLKLFDGNQDEIDVDAEKTISWNTNGVIECYVEIHQVQAIPFEVRVTDENLVAEGYRYTGYTLSAENVTLYGNKEAITSLDSVVLPAVSLKDLSQDLVKEIDVQSLLPDVISVYKDSTTVTVTFKIEKLETKTIDLIGSAITIEGLSEGYEAKVISDLVSIEVEGLSKDLKNIDGTSISGTIDLTDLPVGETRVLPKITTNNTEISIKNIEDVIVVISEITEDTSLYE